MSSRTTHKADGLFYLTLEKLDKRATCCTAKEALYAHTKKLDFNDVYDSALTGEVRSEPLPVTYASMMAVQVHTYIDGWIARNVDAPADAKAAFSTACTEASKLSGRREDHALVTAVMDLLWAKAVAEGRVAP